MTTAIIGSGEMAEGIGTRLVAGGESVLVAGRTPKHVEAVAALLRSRAKNGATVETVGFVEPLDADVVILAVRYRPCLEVLERYGTLLEGKVLVDVSNPMNPAKDELITEPGSSAAEDIARAAPAGAAVVKAFNTTFSEPLIDGGIDGVSLDVFVAGDSNEAKARVIELIELGGMRPIDVGPLRRARALEGFQLLHIILQDRLGTSFRSGVKLVHTP